MKQNLIVLQEGSKDCGAASLLSIIRLLKTRLSVKERLFCMIAYTPKATVQAAIGGIPLSMGLDCGNIVLTVAVLAILITAPFGALGIDSTYEKLLINNHDNFDNKKISGN